MALDEFKFKILLVEDDVDLCATIEDQIKILGHDVVCANTAMKAFEEVNKVNYDCVLTDIKMPEVTGVQLHKLLKEKNIPFLMMSGHTDVDARSAREMGVRGFLRKPFDIAQLELNLSLLLYEKLEKDNSRVGDDYYRVPFEDLGLFQKAKGGVYIRTGPESFAKLADHPTKITEDKVNFLNQKKIKDTYVGQQDYIASMGNSDKEGNAYFPDQEVQPHYKKSLHLLICDRFLDGLQYGNCETEVILRSKIRVDSVLKYLCRHNDFYHTFLLLKDVSWDLIQHSLYVAVTGMALAERVGWKSLLAQFRVCAASLLHDIGMIDMIEIDEKSVKHVTTGLEWYTKTNYLPEETWRAIARHHETMQGTGPLKVVGVKLQPLERLMIVSNAFCELIYGPKALSAEDAIKQLTEKQRDQLDPVFLRALYEVLGLPVPKEFSKVNMAKYAA